MSFNDDEEIVLPRGPKPRMFGGVQLDIRQNTNAPLQAINQKVLLQLTGKGVQLDVVAVLDVSCSMGHDDKIGKMKLAMHFMMKKLTPLDRLSIVKYSTKATRVCKLTQMTEKSQMELANLVEGLKAQGSDNMTNNGLFMALKVLNSRKIHNGRVGIIMLMTDGTENKSSDASKFQCNVPVHIFGFGDGQDSKRLTDITKNSPNGGTYSEVRLENLNLAFSQCLAGLLSVQELTVKVEQEGSTIKSLVSAGSYDQSTYPIDGSVTIEFGDLYMEEVRTVLVDIDIPHADTEGGQDVIKVSYTYKFCGKLEEAPPSFVSVNRLQGLTEEELLAPPEVRVEEVRLLMADLMKQLTAHADKDDLKSAQENLSKGLETLESQYVEQLKARLSNKLNEFKRLMKTKEIYDQEGRHFANSLLISLATQRQAAGGEDISQFQLFSTPAMQQLLKEAQESNDKDKLNRYMDALIKVVEAVEQIINHFMNMNT